MIPKAIRDRLGLRPAEVEVEVFADGAGLRVELLAEDQVGERAGRLFVPATGTPLDDEDIRALRDGDQR